MRYHTRKARRNKRSTIMGRKREKHRTTTEDSCSGRSVEHSLEGTEGSGLIGIREQRINNLSRDIVLEQFTVAYKGQVLLKDADLTIVHGRKYGLIAPNGAGKSTLLLHIAQRYFPIPDHIKILYVAQEIAGSETSALAAVIEADTERSRLLQEERMLRRLIDDPQGDADNAAQERILEVYDQLKQIGAYSAEARAAGILSGLAFTPEMQLMPTKEFSGGWRMRIALACALFVQPTLLLLDEPTNHLDLDAVIWLEAYLRKYKKTLIVCSHDREFLNAIVTDILVIDELKLHHFKGNYDAYEQTKLQKQREQERRAGREGRKLRVSRRKVSFHFSDPPELAEPVLQVKSASFVYANEKDNIFEDLELNIAAHSKIAVVGPNGSGKSTLLNLLIGHLEPTQGEILRNRKLRVAKFSQHLIDQLNMNESAIAYIHRRYPHLREQEVRNSLGAFGLKGRANHEKNINLLSGGQKSRVALLEIALAEPHILFMDEPTNHLDIQSVDALADALRQYTGGVVFVSHDQRLVSRVADELWVCKGKLNGTVELYNGTFEDYKKELINEMPSEWFLDD